MRRRIQEFLITDGITALPCLVEAILSMREDYRRAMNAQIVHDSWHARGFTSPYLLRRAGEPVGYGAVGAPPGEARDTVKEFYLVPAARSEAGEFFRTFLAATQARWIAVQTNDPFLFPLAELHARALTVEALLFAEGRTTTLTAPDVLLRRVTAEDQATVFPHTTEPVGDWGLEQRGLLVATGGLFFHYNPPYGDIYMEVAPAHRRKGYGAYLVQELKRICRSMDRVPAARCQADNAGSRGALERAGMHLCGRIVRGAIAV